MPAFGPPIQLFRDVNDVRGFRNAIVHQKRWAPTPNDVQLALRTAYTMIERQWSIRFTPNYSYSVTGV